MSADRRRTTGWLTPTAAARRLRVKIRTLYAAIDHGELPAYRYAPRIIRIRSEDLAAYQRQK